MLMLQRWLTDVLITLEPFGTKGELAGSCYPRRVSFVECPSGKGRSRRGLAVMAAHKWRKLLNQGRRANPAPENKQTDPAPIRARTPLIEQYYVAVDRQLKSGFGTY